MTEIVLAKGAGNFLYPCDQQGAALIARLKLGAGVTASIKRNNNPQFHRKLMALFNLAFDAWEPVELEYQGQIVRKEFNQFRKDITILAGYYDSSINFRGDVRLTAKSLNFSVMEQDEREALFSAVIDVVLGKILTSYTRDDIENVIAQTLEFAR